MAVAGAPFRSAPGQRQYIIREDPLVLLGRCEGAPIVTTIRNFGASLATCETQFDSIPIHHR